MVEGSAHESGWFYGNKNLEDRIRFDRRIRDQDLETFKHESAIALSVLRRQRESQMKHAP